MAKHTVRFSLPEVPVRVIDLVDLLALANQLAFGPLGKAVIMI